MSESKKNLISEGSVTVVGKNWEGKDVEVTADIKDFAILVENEHEYLSSIYNYSHLASTRSKTTFSMGIIEGKYVVKVPSLMREPVERTARVLGWEDPHDSIPREPSIALLKAAAEKAGVDESTEFVLHYEKDFPSETNKVYVEFRWTD